MEKDLNLRKLFLMYLRNVWIILFVGVLFAVAAFVFRKEDTAGAKNVSETVTMVFEIHDGTDEGTYSRRTVYFDNFRGLIAGNVIAESDVFTKAEKEMLADISTEELNGTFTITFSVPSDTDEDDALEIMEKYVSETEKWMRQNIDDPTFKLNVLKRNVEDVSGGDAVKLAIVFFIIGCFLTVIVMFFIFVLETGIHDSEDMQYYTAISPIFEFGKKNPFAADEIGRWLISSGKKTVMFFGNKSGNGLDGALEEICALLKKHGIKASVYKISESDGSNPAEAEEKLTKEKSNNDMVLIETPILSQSPIALHISSLCDLKVLNIDVDRENGVKLKKKLADLSALDFTVDGAVLNGYTKNKIFRL